MFSIQKVSSADIEILMDIAGKTFRDAFYDLCDPIIYDAYAFKAFAYETLLCEFNNPDSQFYFAINNDELYGYLKLNFNTAQTELREPEGMEIERLYILKNHQNQGIGSRLIDFAVTTAIEKQMKYVWLGVWEKNLDAMRLYERNGFKIFGRHTFHFGDDQEEDWLMKRDL